MLARGEYLPDNLARQVAAAYSFLCHCTAKKLRIIGSVVDCGTLSTFYWSLHWLWNGKTWKRWKFRQKRYCLFHFQCRAQ
jgi:hypothetical protein